MAEFIKIATTTDLADGEKKLCVVDDELVLLFRRGDEFFCIDDICTHDGGTLSDGQFSGCEIACPRHGAKFDIRNGKALSMPATQSTRSHEIQLAGDDVMVRLSDD